jgi:putative flavoprotein involved in K+ transport
MSQKIDTVIIGGGQAGLGVGYFLDRLGVEFTILEQSDQPANAWRNDRWDSFTLLTPNWSFRLPGAWYQESDRDGFMTKDEIIRHFEAYILQYHLPVQYGVKVELVERNSHSYHVKTKDSLILAENVVVATGLFQGPKFPDFSRDLDRKITQLHSGQYRNPTQLPPGVVLVVGSSQSGAQIAEELYLSGRKVYLCTSSAGRVPRRYRGKDIVEWLFMSGFFDRTPAQLPVSGARFMGSLAVSGLDGGRSLNTHKFARDGVTLLGHIRGGSGHMVEIAPDRNENLAKSDKLEADIVKMVDTFIARSGIQTPPEELPRLQHGYAGEEICQLDLHAAGITSIVWANGYRFNFGMVKLPVVDEFGFPIQQRGVSEYPGVYFVGMPWMDKWKSGILLGFSETAGYVAEKIVERIDEKYKQ